MKCLAQGHDKMKTFVLTMGIYLVFSVTAAQELVKSNELSMMDQSIDDMFSGCTEKMAKKVRENYFPKEIQNSPFGEAWNMADLCAKKELERLQTKSSKLNINHTRAMCVYTMEKPDVYNPLNAAMNTGASFYGTSFQYHALSFWLTTALQLLKGPCQITYRKTDVVFNGNKGDKIRFGQFASSSKRTDLTDFGSNSCFYIQTCFGANIRDYSAIKQEEEVLIPPYETFRITEIATDSYKDLKCNKIFVLKSAGKKTRLNCKAVNHNQQIRASLPLILVLLAFGWFAIESVSNAKMKN